MQDYIFASIFGGIAILVTYGVLSLLWYLISTDPFGFLLGLGTISVGPLCLYLYRRYWKENVDG